MRAWPRAVLAVAVIAGSFGIAGAPVASAANSEKVIVVYKDSVDAAKKTEALSRSNLVVPEFQYGAALKGFSATVTPTAKARLAADPDVAFVSPDRPVRMYEATAPVASGESIPTGVERIKAAVSNTKLAQKASDVGVAVLDTGISTRTGNLNVGAGKKCIGWSTNDDNGHGTHVAGTIAAQNSGSRVIGVAPGTKVYPVKVLDRRGSGTWSSVICGIDWVTANAQLLNIKVANMSLGGIGTSDTSCGTTNSDALHAAICRGTNAGVTFVVAAGNDRVDIATQTPGAYPEVLTVTAMSDANGAPGGGLAPSCRTSENDDAPASFSNYATQTREMNHTIAAPGVCINSLSTSTWSTTKKLSGTSMASPHVAGAVALCISKAAVPGPCAGKTPAQIIDKLRTDAAAQPSSFGFAGDPVHAPSSRYYGYLVNAGLY